VLPTSMARKDMACHVGELRAAQRARLRDERPAPAPAAAGMRRSPSRLVSCSSWCASSAAAALGRAPCRRQPAPPPVPARHASLRPRTRKRLSAVPVQQGAALIALTARACSGTGEQELHRARSILSRSTRVSQRANPPAPLSMGLRIRRGRLPHLDLVAHVLQPARDPGR
jgi:hypothetical protein